MVNIKNTLLHTIEYPLYLKRVMLSSKRQPKYYTPTCKIKNKKLNDRTRFVFSEYKKTKKQYLVDVKTGERVLKNPRAAGTPKYMSINAQHLYNQNLHEFSRDKIVRVLHSFFEEGLKSIPRIDVYPLMIIMEIHDTILEETSSWDVGNRGFFYQKTFEDVLKKDKIIDDSSIYISMPPAPIFIPVATAEERKLVFSIYHITDERIVNDVYKSYAQKENINHYDSF